MHALSVQPMEFKLEEIWDTKIYTLPTVPVLIKTNMFRACMRNFALSL